MSPSPAQRSRATRTPPEAPRPRGSPAAQPSRVPNVRDAAWRLFLSRLPHAHTARAPKTTLLVPIQWNVTTPNSSEPPSAIPEAVSGLRDRRVKARTQTSPCETQDPGGDGDPRLPPRPTSRTSPGRESCTGRPHRPRDHPTGVISRLSGGGEDQETRGGFPARPGPLDGAAQGRRPQMHPRPFPAHQDPAAHPPYLALRLGLLPLLPLLVAAATAARGS